MTGKPRPSNQAEASARAKRRDRAIALQYQDVDQIPRVLASGAGELARQIVRLAEQHGVALHQNSALAELLSKLPAGAVISPDTYRLVAEIICFLYYTDQEWRAAHDKLSPLLDCGEACPGVTVSGKGF